MDIYSGEELQDITGFENVQLEEDITITESFETIEEFHGVLDGQGHTISGLSSTFIEIIESDGVVKNVNIEESQFSDSTGIFKLNEGIVKSVSVTELEKNYGGKLSKSSCFGGIVNENRGVIKDCSIVDSSIRETNISGGICRLSKNGNIINCKVENICIYGDNFSGGVVGSSENSTIKDCSIVNLEVIGSNNVGGVIGKSRNSNVSNVTIDSSHVEASLSFAGAIIGDSGENTNIEEALITDVDVLAFRYVSVIGFLGTGLIKDCTVRDCSVNSISNSQSMALFSYNGEVKNTFIENTKVDCDSVVFTQSKHENVYIDIVTDQNTSIQNNVTSEDGSFYFEVSKVNFGEKSKHVKVSEPSDLEKINTKDTVELTQDINLKNYNIDKLNRFSGTFDGNGHTISNLIGPLFNYFTGTIRDLNLTEPEIGVDCLASFISQHMHNSTAKNVSITKTDVSRDEPHIYGLAWRIKESKIFKCDFSFNFGTENVNFNTIHGIYSLTASLDGNSVVKQCSISYNINNFRAAGFSRSTEEQSQIINTTLTGNIELNSENTFYGLVRENYGKLEKCQSDISIIHNESKLSNELSGLCGVNNGLIKNCQFNGEIILKNVISEPDSRGLSGICGHNRSGVIKDSVNKGSIDAKIDEPVGGVCGINRSLIKNCINKCGVTSRNKTGGISGKNAESAEKIVNCSNTGKIQGKKQTGGILGCKEENSGYIEACYNKSIVKGEEADLIFGGDTDIIVKNTYIIPVDDEQSSEYAEITDVEESKLRVILGI